METAATVTVDQPATTPILTLCGRPAAFKTLSMLDLIEARALREAERDDLRSQYPTFFANPDTDPDRHRVNLLFDLRGRTLPFLYHAWDAGQCGLAPTISEMQQANPMEIARCTVAAVMANPILAIEEPNVFGGLVPND